MRAYLPALAGGGLIGLAVAMLMLLNGRIAGVSGIVAGIGEGRGERRLADIAFVIGLVAGPFVFLLAVGHLPEIRLVASIPVLLAAGFLVGFGTRLGSGCTSGHGVAGLARLSPRSFVAVLAFVACGMATVAATRIFTP